MPRRFCMFLLRLSSHPVTPLPRYPVTPLPRYPVTNHKTRRQKVFNHLIYMLL